MCVYACMSRMHTPQASMQTVTHFAVFLSLPLPTEIPYMHIYSMEIIIDLPIGFPINNIICLHHAAWPEACQLHGRSDKKRSNLDLLEQHRKRYRMHARLTQSCRYTEYVCQRPIAVLRWSDRVAQRRLALPTHSEEGTPTTIDADSSRECLLKGEPHQEGNLRHKTSRSYTGSLRVEGSKGGKTYN